MADEMTRPHGVPAEAWWDQADATWVLGPRDAEGRRHGEVTFWRADGSMSARATYADGELHGPLERFHPSGERSQTATFVKGKPHGTRAWFSIDQPSPELTRARGMSDRIMRSEMDHEHGLVIAVRHFDGDGVAVSADGEPLPARPAGVPEAATWHPAERAWQQGAAREDRTPVGTHTGWRADGSLWMQTDYADDGSVRCLRRFHPDGAVASVVDLEARTGFYRRTSGPTDEAPPSTLPAEAAELRYQLRVVNAKTGLHWEQGRRYFDAAGAELTEVGRAFQDPHPDAELVTDGSWMNPATYWRHAAEPDGEQVTTYWRRDGTVFLTETRRDGALVRLVTHDESGEPLIDEAFHPGRRDARERPVHARCWIRLEDGHVEHRYGADERLVSVRRVRADGATVTLPGVVEGLDAEGFEEAFEERFGEANALRAVRCWLDTCDVSHVEVGAYDEFAPLWTLTGNGGGDNTVLVGAGQYGGQVFYLDHERMYCLDDIGETLEEAGLDPAEADVDAILAALPFIQEPVADSVSEFLAQIRVGSRWIRYGDLQKFKPLAP